MCMQVKSLPIEKFELNNGQVEGLPKNPRFIRDERYLALKKSITEFPEMLSYREIVAYPLENGNYVVVGGNMRLRACREMGLKSIPVKILPKETPVEKLREFTIKDNVSFGQISWDDLANEWEQTELEDWGMEMNFGSDDLDIDDFFNEDAQAGEKEEKHKITLEYSEEEHGIVLDALKKIASTPEMAVWKLLNLGD